MSPRNKVCHIIGTSHSAPIPSICRQDMSKVDLVLRELKWLLAFTVVILAACPEFTTLHDTR